MITLVNSTLPAMSGSNVTYNNEHNIFLARGYTSSAGYTYFQGIRLSDRLIVMYDFGQGWAHLFLNGIRLYGYNGTEKKLLTSRSYFNFYFSESAARRECEDLLLNFMKTQSRMLSASVCNSQLEDFVHAMIGAVGAVTNRPMLA